MWRDARLKISIFIERQLLTWNSDVKLGGAKIKQRMDISQGFTKVVVRGCE